GRQLTDHLGDLLAVGTGGRHPLLGLDDAGGRDELHGARDLLGGLDALDAPAEDPFLAARHAYPLPASPAPVRRPLRPGPRPRRSAPRPRPSARRCPPGAPRPCPPGAPRSSPRPPSRPPPPKERTAP